MHEMYSSSGGILVAEVGSLGLGTIISSTFILATVIDMEVTKT